MLEFLTFVYTYKIQLVGMYLITEKAQYRIFVINDLSLITNVVLRVKI